MLNAPVELLVCTRCLAGAEAAEDHERPGAVLLRRLEAEAAGDLRLTPVACLSNCSQGCTIALRGPRRWTYVYGRIDAQGDLSGILDGAQKYAATDDGLVPWRDRPEHFRRNCIARIPPLSLP